MSAASPLDCFQFDDELTRVTAHYTLKVRYRLLPMLPTNLIGEAIHAIDTHLGAGEPLTKLLHRALALLVPARA